MRAQDEKGGGGLGVFGGESCRGRMREDIKRLGREYLLVDGSRGDWWCVR